MKNDTTPFDGFTEHVGAALKFAQEEAQRLGCSAIDPEHLLLGLLANPTSRAASVLCASGCELESARASVVALFQSDAQPVVVAQPSELTKHIIRLAVVEARRLHSSILDTDHFLLGILHEEQGGAWEILNGLGISLDIARVEVERARSGQVASTASTAPTSPAGAVQIDQKRQEQAVAFARSRRRIRSIYLFLLFAVLILCFIGALTFSQISSSIMMLMIELDDAPVLSWHPIAGWMPCLVLFYSMLISLFIVVFSLPLTWLSGFRLLRRYGLLKEKTSTWLMRSIASLGLVMLFLWLFAELISLLIIVQPQLWWAWAALVQFLFSLAMSRFGLTLLIRLSKGRICPVSEGEIVERLHMLLDRLQLPPCPLFVIKVSHRTNSANAYFSGIGRGRRIRLTDTMVSSFTLDEIEVILAHELGHYVHHDIWTRLIMRGGIILALLYVLYLLFNPTLFISLVPSQLASFIPLLGYLLVLVFVYITFSYRRYQEYQADEFALQATGKVQTFKDAMTKLTNMGLVVAVSTRRARHPASHPALVKRLQHADGFAARQHIAPIS